MVMTVSRTDACGALGCRKAPTVVIDHPGLGERTVCQTHADRAVDLRDAEVLRRV